MPFKPGRGVDVGTCFLVSAQCDAATSDTTTKSVRDSFLELLPPNKLVLGTMRKGLEKAGVNFFETEGKFFVLGDDSLVQSVERQMIARRPMARGVISPAEVNSLPLFKALFKELLGQPLCPNERIVYSIPAAPLDAPFDVHYHTQVLENILSSLGFSASPLNEAEAIILSELGSEEDAYTGIACSFGAGAVNVAIANMADVIVKFSVSKSGDYIDQATALSLGYDPMNPKTSSVTPSLVCFIKEQGVNILEPGEDQIKVGIAAHYKNLIHYVIKQIIDHLSRVDGVPKFLKSVPIVISGGTSLAPGFMEKFKMEFDSQRAKLPFEIREIRQAKNPLTAVAEGCLIALMAEM